MKFYEYPIPSIIVGTEKIVINQSGITKSSTLSAIIDDMGLMSGVSVNGLSNGDVLIYNSSTLKWENGSIGTTGYTGEFVNSEGGTVVLVDGVVTDIVAAPSWWTGTREFEGNYGTRWANGSGWTFEFNT